MKKLKLNKNERKEIENLYADDFYCYNIADFFFDKYPRYFNKCEKKIVISYGVKASETRTFSFDDYDFESNDFYLDLMYELLKHTNIKKERLVY